MTIPHPSRRAFVRGLRQTAFMAALVAAARPLSAATPVPEAASLLVPGPEDGAIARFATKAAGAFARGLVQAVALRVQVVGGADGITAANRFASLTPADGRALLLLPGVAAQAQLLGDSRARFEPRRWPALASSLQPVVLAGRGAMGNATPIRVALPGPGTPEAAGLLLLELIGRRCQAVFTAQPELALTQGAADAMVLSGLAAQRAAAQGLTPWFAFDGADSARDPAMPEVPTMGEMLGEVRGEPARQDLAMAARAVGAALRTRALIVLPTLTSADAVALWRGAAQRWAEEEPDSLEAGARRIAGSAAADLLATLCPTSEVTLAYRDWLLRRFNWRAG